MDKNGQMSFSDDPLLNETSEIFEFISEGKFDEAVKRSDALMDIDPEYPGLAEAYRTAKFWGNRRSEFNRLDEGKKTADFLLEEWESYEKYAEEMNMIESAPYRAVTKFIFLKASDNYKLAFQKNEDSINEFDLLVNLGECFLRLKNYQYTVETLEFAKNSHRSNVRLLFILGEAYYHIDEIPKSLMSFQEAFLINPAEVDLKLIKAKPIKQIISAIGETGRVYQDVREWIPVYGVVLDIFFIKKRINKHQLETLEREIYKLESNLVHMTKGEREESNILPRVINKYLWIYDYYENQSLNPENIEQIRNRLLDLDSNLFLDFFARKSKTRI